MSKRRKSKIENMEEVKVVDNNEDLAEDFQKAPAKKLVTKPQTTKKIQEKTMEFDQAFRIYKKTNKIYESYDAEAVKVFTLKKIGKNKATKEEFFEVFKRY